MERSHQTFFLRPDIVVTTLESEAVLLDLETKYFFSINPSGWALGQIFEQGATMAQVSDACRAAEAPPSFHESIEAFVAELLDERLLTTGDPVDAPHRIEFGGPWEHPILTKHKEPLQQVVVSAFDPTLPLAE